LRNIKMKNNNEDYLFKYDNNGDDFVFI